MNKQKKMLEEVNKSNGISKISEFISSRNNHLNLTNTLNIKSPTKKYYDVVKPKIKNREYENKIISQNVTINTHFKPKNVPDTIAFYFVKFLRSFADAYFRKNYVNRAIALETVAAIPGMVGGLQRHLYSLRTFKDNGKTIQKLLSEAENERQHLLAFLEVGKPRIFDLILIRGVQPVFFAFYMVFYGLFPKTAHRFVGYLEEEAIRSYDSFEQEILDGNIKNIKAPKSSIIYWNLGDNARLIDLVRAVRADEARHRDTNHELANEKPLTLS